MDAVEQRRIGAGRRRSQDIVDNLVDYNNMWYSGKHSGGQNGDIQVMSHHVSTRMLEAREGRKAAFAALAPEGAPRA